VDEYTYWYDPRFEAPDKCERRTLTRDKGLGQAQYFMGLDSDENEHWETPGYQMLAKDFIDFGYEIGLGS